jgi:hypothetical protein
MKKTFLIECSDTRQCPLMEQSYVGRNVAQTCKVVSLPHTEESRIKYNLEETHYNLGCDGWLNDRPDLCPLKEVKEISSKTLPYFEASLFRVSYAEVPIVKKEKTLEDLIPGIGDKIAECFSSKKN